MHKKLLVVLSAILMILSIKTIAFAAETPTITVSSAEANIGETVQLKVSLINNPGINTFSLGFDYDTSKLNLLGVEFEPGISGQFVYVKKAVWLNNKDITTNGNYLMLNFKVLDNATPGEAEVTVTYNKGDISNYDEDDLEFDIVAGKVIVQYSGDEGGSDDDVDTCKHSGGTATCIDRAICGFCHKEYGEYDLDNHKLLVLKDEIPATCTSPGLSKGIYCEACDRMIVLPSIIMGGHEYDDNWTVDKKATTSVDGSKSKHCIRCDAKTSVTKIYKASGVKLSTSSYTYNGKIKSPKVYIKNSKGKTISSSNYTITKPSGRKNVGKYTYTIKFKNEYSGTKKLTLTIDPKGTNISSVSAAKKAFTVKWKKQSEKMATSRITGYQIQYSTSKKFTSPKTVTVSGYSNISKKITKLSAKKTYYVRIRTYKIVNGTRYYSKWSAYKSVKTK